MKTRFLQLLQIVLLVALIAIPRVQAAPSVSPPTLPPGATLQHLVVTVDLGKLGMGTVALYSITSDNYSGIVQLKDKLTRLPHIPAGHYETTVKAIFGADICKSGQRALVVLQSTRQIGNTTNDGNFAIAYTFDGSGWRVHMPRGTDGNLLLGQPTAKAVRAALLKPAVCAAFNQPDPAENFDSGE